MTNAGIFILIALVILNLFIKRHVFSNSNVLPPIRPVTLEEDLAFFEKHKAHIISVIGEAEHKYRIDLLKSFIEKKKAGEKIYGYH